MTCFPANKVLEDVDDLLMKGLDISAKGTDEDQKEVMSGTVLWGKTVGHHYMIYETQSSDPSGDVNKILTGLARRGVDFTERDSKDQPAGKTIMEAFESYKYEHPDYLQSLAASLKEAEKISRNISLSQKSVKTAKILIDRKSENHSGAIKRAIGYDRPM